MEKITPELIFFIYVAGGILTFMTSLGLSNNPDKEKVLIISRSFFWPLWAVFLFFYTFKLMWQKMKE